MTVLETSGRKRSIKLTTIVGLVLVAVGASLLGYVGWEYFGTNIVAKHRQSELSQGLASRWRADGADGDADHDKLATGEAMALLRIPRFGKDYEVPIVKGVDDDSLASGVGWFPKTARPGQVGNFALAGHRVTHGEPFHDFPELRKGDKVVVETRTHVYTYRLRDNGTDRTLDFSQTWVLDPVPGKPEVKPTEAMITLVTCSELFHTDNRNVVFGDLVTTEHKENWAGP
ncbi:MAG: class E sortase [Nocardioidaceae bacterium]